jgi:hypothetical protein
MSFFEVVRAILGFETFPEECPERAARAQRRVPPPITGYRRGDYGVGKPEAPPSTAVDQEGNTFKLSWIRDGLSITGGGKAYNGELYEGLSTQDVEPDLLESGKRVKAASLQRALSGVKTLELESESGLLSCRYFHLVSAGHGCVDCWNVLTIDPESRTFRLEQFQAYDDCR